MAINFNPKKDASFLGGNLSSSEALSPAPLFKKDPNRVNIFDIPNLAQPEREIVNLDSGTLSLMDQRAKEALKTPEQLAAERMQGVSQDPNLAFEQQKLQSAGLMGNMQPFASAIEKRQKKNYLSDLNRISRQANLDALSEKQQLLASAARDKTIRANVQAGVADRNRQQELNNWQYQNYRKSQRDRTILELFNSSATAGGGALGASGQKAGAQQVQANQGMGAGPTPTSTTQAPASYSSKNYGGYA